MTQPLPAKIIKFQCGVCLVTQLVVSDSVTLPTVAIQVPLPGGIFSGKDTGVSDCHFRASLFDPEVSAESPVLQADSLLSCQGSPKFQ